MSSTEGAGGPVVLLQDTWLLAVSKPAGMPVQADPTQDLDLVTWARSHFKDAGIGLVHRIDRPVSGVVLLARSPDALPLLHALFSERSVCKCYWALVEGVVPVGAMRVLENTLEHDARSKRARTVPMAGGKVARTQVRVLASGERYSLVEAVPEGGAFHQIRAQMSAWGHPIKGDVKYGARRGEKDRSIALHARSLRFTHPFTHTEVHIEAAPPSGSLWAALIASQSSKE